ncbi:hypothetical protein AAY42_12530 [Flagellimonas eckloniae]|uniref:Lipoprotein n=2 Tax=Flagellimonas eckloniae TaxID=346185 RepID=A0A0Q1DNK5_9FLAO|nr:hypothetical protein AAY42_12530 [Allomuricauda eckloniae]
MEFDNKVSLYFLVFSLTILGCKDENKIYKIDRCSDLGISLIEHIYVFEDEGFEINAFFVQKSADRNEYILNLCLKGNIIKLSKDHRAFVHGFKNFSSGDKSINIVLNNTKTLGDSLVFHKALILKKDSLFEKVTFGVENKTTKQRKFVLTLKNVDLHEFAQ